MTDARWRVATANIRHGLGPDRRVDLLRTAAELRALRAEVIGLQEVDVAFGARSDHRDQAAELAALLGMRVAFGPALDLGPAHEGGPHRRYGVAVLTVHELLENEMHRLPGHPGVAAASEPRGVLRTRLRRPDRAELEAWVTHLDSSSRAHRSAQVQGIIDLTRTVDGPVVLMGDMNAGPRSPELAGLTATGWREAARELGTAARATHPSRFPIRRLDQIWMRGAVTASSLAVGPRGSSDHRPVVADLRAGA